MRCLRNSTVRCEIGQWFTRWHIVNALTISLLFISDPKQRLALFRKLEETSPAGGAVHMPNRKAVIKKEYFQGRLI